MISKNQSKAEANQAANQSTTPQADQEVRKGRRIVNVKMNRLAVLVQDHIAMPMARRIRII
jgi:hypothetical protein